MNVSRCGVWGLVMVLAACSPTARRPPPSASFFAWLDRGPAIKKLCVLPFTNRTGKPGLDESVRQSVYGHLSVRGFHDVELSEIDAALRTLPQEWQILSPQALGRRLGCDGLVYGEVAQSSWFYLAVYSQLTLGGGIRLVDARSGSLLVEAAYTARFHAGGVPLSPLGVMPASILAFRNILENQPEKAVDDLGRHLVEFIPDLAVSVRAKPQEAPRVVALAPPVSNLPAQAKPASKPGAAALDIAVAAPPAVGAPMEKSHYRLQVASFHNSGEAERAARRLQSKGYHPSVVEVKNTAQSWHRVLVGPFSSVKEAQKTQARIQETLGFAPLMTWVDNN